MAQVSRTAIPMAMPTALKIVATSPEIMLLLLADEGGLQNETRLSVSVCVFWRLPQDSSHRPKREFHKKTGGRSRQRLNVVNMSHDHGRSQRLGRWVACAHGLSLGGGCLPGGGKLATMTNTGAETALAGTLSAVESVLTSGETAFGSEPVKREVIASV